MEQHEAYARRGLVCFFSACLVGAPAVLSEVAETADVEVPLLGSMDAGSVSPVLFFDMRISKTRFLEDNLPNAEVVYSSSVVGVNQPAWVSYVAVHGQDGGIDVTAVLAGEKTLGVFISRGGDECVWADAKDMLFVTDQFGHHPVISTAGNEWAVVQGQDNVAGLFGADWSDVPLKGASFRRNWKQHPHLSDNTPARDAVIFRFEGGHKFIPKNSGRGNTPHHWNLLAYALTAETKYDGNVSPGSKCGRLFTEQAWPREWVAQYGALFSASWNTQARANFPDSDADQDLLPGPD